MSNTERINNALAKGQYKFVFSDGPIPKWEFERVAVVLEIFPNDEGISIFISRDSSDEDGCASESIGICAADAHVETAITTLIAYLKFMGC